MGLEEIFLSNLLSTFLLNEQMSYWAKIFNLKPKSSILSFCRTRRGMQWAKIWKNDFPLNYIKVLKCDLYCVDDMSVMTPRKGVPHKDGVM